MQAKMPMQVTYNRLARNTPMQLARAGASVEFGAALLVLRRGCSLGTARRAMEQAYRVLHAPIETRLTDGLTKIACDTQGLEFGPVQIGDARAELRQQKADAARCQNSSNPDAGTPATQRAAVARTPDCPDNYLKVSTTVAGVIRDKTVPVQYLITENRDALVQRAA